MSELDDIRARVTRLEQEILRARAEVAACRRRSPARVAVQSAVLAVLVLLAMPHAPSAQASRVRAPFEVVDAAGQAIFIVREDPRGFAIRDKSGQITAVASALPSASFFKIVGNNGANEAVLGVAPSAFAGFTARERGRDRIAMGIDANIPVLSLNGTTGRNVVSLRQSNVTGGGILELGNSGGDPRVKAGVNEFDRGSVQAHPLGPARAGLVGMPGTFISGWAGSGQ